MSFPRPLQADRWVEILVSGTTDDDWLVTSARIESPYFEAAAAVGRNVRLFDGSLAHVKVPLGAVTCPADASRKAVAYLELVHDSGATSSLTLELPEDVLIGINQDECEAKAVTDIAMPNLGKPQGGEGTIVESTLSLTRGTVEPHASVTVTAMRGSVIFGMEPMRSEELPLTLAAGADGASINVVFEASRCDDHAFAESKKTFVFPVWLSVDGAEPVYYELRPEPDLKQALQEAFDACGQS